MIGALYRCREYLHESTLLNIYNAYFLSIIRYLITIWGTCRETLFSKAQRLQNKIVKILFNLDYRTPTNTVYEQTKILTLIQILKIEQCKFIYKALNNNLKCNTELIFVNQIHNYDTRNQTRLFQNKVTTVVGYQNPISKSIDNFNTIPLEIVNKPEFRHFKKELVKFVTNYR